jgi:hypothetical protein
MKTIPNIDEMLRRLEFLKTRMVHAKQRQEDGKSPFTLRPAFQDLAELFSEFKPISKVLIFEEKHDNLYYDGSTRELVWLACYDVVKDRNDLGYWYSHYRDIPENPEVPVTPLEEADTAEEPVAQAIRAMWDTYNSEKRELDERRAGARALKAALECEGKTSAAKSFLEQYDCGEYCAFRLESLVEIEDEA